MTDQIWAKKENLAFGINFVISQELWEYPKAQPGDEKPDREED